MYPFSSSPQIGDSRLRVIFSNLLTTSWVGISPSTCFRTAPPAAAIFFFTQPAAWKCSRLRFSTYPRQLFPAVSAVVTTDHPLWGAPSGI